MVCKFDYSLYVSPLIDMVNREVKNIRFVLDSLFVLWFSLLTGRGINLQFGRIPEIELQVVNSISTGQIALSQFVFFIF